ncbi:MAG: response regulator [Vicinamibacteria bacterium]|nr:response regulator [Vicinamibacteria bacterium]
MRVLVVDDEPLARVQMRMMLAEHADVEIVGEASALDEAAALVGTCAPDAIFLDIHLGQASGFSLLGSLPASTRVVFVTAHADHAVRAFDAAAVDYLLKPVRRERLAESLERLRAVTPAFGARPLASPAGGPLRADDWLFLPSGRSRFFVRVREVRAVVAARDYSEVLAGPRGAALVEQPLREWEARLPDGLFTRIHRSAIVNLDFVERVEALGSGLGVVVRDLPRPLPISRRQGQELRDRLR